MLTSAATVIIADVVGLFLQVLFLPVLFPPASACLLVKFFASLNSLVFYYLYHATQRVVGFLCVCSPFCQILFGVLYTILWYRSAVIASRIHAFRLERRF